MRVDEFDFQLPADLIADRPANPRDDARLLVHERETGRRWHRRFRELGEFLKPGDLLVLNDTLVLPHRLIGRRSTGGRVECLILQREGRDCRGYVRPARKVRPGESIAMEDGSLHLVPMEDLGEGLYRFRLESESAVEEALARVGRAPLPPYIQRSEDQPAAEIQADRRAYQTIYATAPGAVAAPTAGLHFTPGLLEELSRRGVVCGRVTLHVGEGTFAPVRVDQVEDHVMHTERYDLPAATADLVAETRDRGGRVVAVGTTTARTLETRASATGLVTSGSGESDLFLYPGRPLRVVDALITNFHLPRSTLLMLVAAFTGLPTLLDLYREAVAERYRFYSFGDAMLIL